MDNSKIRPILKPFDYRKGNNEILKEKLHDYEFSPLIVYGEDVGGAIAFKQYETEDQKISEIDEIRKIALLNIEQIEVQHSVQDIQGEKLFELVPHEYASEKILDKKFLAFVGEQIGSNNIVVGIPYQGAFYAVSLNGKLKDVAAGLSKQNFENPKANPITPHVFLIQNQIIVGIGGENFGETKNNGIERNANGDFVVKVDEIDINLFSEQISNGYTQALLLAMQDSQFSGRIIIDHLNQKFEYTPEIIERSKSFQSKVRDNEMAQTVCKAICGNGIEIHFSKMGKMVDLNVGKQNPVGKLPEKPWWKIW